MTMSLILSIMIWVIVFPSTVPDQAHRNLRIKVFEERLPPGLTITNYDDTIDVSAVGAENKISKLDPEKISAVVSLADAKAGQKRYPVTIYPPQFQEFFNDRPYSVLFTIEPIATRTLPVEVETFGQLPDTTIALEDTLADPTQVTVSGPKSVVEKLAKARAPLDLSMVDVANKSAQTLAVDLINADGSALQNVEIDVQPKLVRVTPILASAPQQKPVFVNPSMQGSPAEGFIAAGYEITPNQIILRGSSRALAAVTQIATDAFNVDGIKQTTDYIVNLKMPPGLTADKKRVTVRVLVKPVPAIGGNTPGQ